MKTNNFDRKTMPRVAFIAHVLAPNYFSTLLIDKLLKRLNVKWGGEGSMPGAVKWLSFPVKAPHGSGGKDVWMDFYIITAFAPWFLRNVDNNVAYPIVEKVALDAIREAKKDGVHITLGWGALTKNVTHHGVRFLDENPWVKDDPMISTTHGDAGTAFLAIKALQNIGVSSDATIAVLGARGTIGNIASQMIAMTIEPSKLLLVGRADDFGSADRLSRLTALGKEVSSRSPQTNVVLSQDVTRACIEHHAKLIVVATTGVRLLPQQIPEDAVILDLTTPSACSSEHEWGQRLVIQGGCGVFADPSLLPGGFGINGSVLWNVGAAVTKTGGERVLWGCAGESIARAMFEWTGHITGQFIKDSDLTWVEDAFRRMVFLPQPPISFGHGLEWSDVFRGPQRGEEGTQVL